MGTITCICISKEQLTTGNDFVIVNHTKNYKTRFFPLTKDLKDFLSRLKIMHDKYYPDSKYLFPADTDNGAITNRNQRFHYKKNNETSGIRTLRIHVKSRDIASSNLKSKHLFGNYNNCITNISMVQFIYIKETII